MRATTPFVSSLQLSTVSNLATCDYITTACDRYSRYTDFCQNEAAQSATESCYCQPAVQYVESICSIDGGALCSTQSVDFRELWGYRECPTWLGITGVSSASFLSLLRSRRLLTDMIWCIL